MVTSYWHVTVISSTTDLLQHDSVVRALCENEIASRDEFAIKAQEAVRHLAFHTSQLECKKRAYYSHHVYNTRAQ
jgi:hypothetical protein